MPSYTVSNRPNIRIGKGLGDVSEETLRFFHQIGVEAVWMPARFVERMGTAPTVRPLVPPTQRKPVGDQPPAWNRDELLRIRERAADEGKTILVGRLKDQAALAGVLAALYELHLPVSSVECLEAG